MSKKHFLSSEDLKQPWVDAFMVGEFTDMRGKPHSFSESDLEKLNSGIQSQLANGYKPPVVKGHPKMDDPRVASIVDSKVEGNIVKVKLDEVNPLFAEEVKSGGFKYLSSSIFGGALEKGLRHLGALGAVGPAMKGMNELCFGEGMFAEVDKGETEDNVICFAERYDWDSLVPRTVFESLVYRLSSIGKIFRGQREQLIASKGVEEADKVFPESTIKEVEDVESVLKYAADFPQQVSPTNGGKEEGSFSEPAEGGDGAPPPAPGEPTGVAPEGNSTEPVPPTESNENPLEKENSALKAELELLKKEKKADENKAEIAVFSERLNGMISDGRMNVELKGELENAFAVALEVPVNGDGCFAESGVNPKQAVLNILDKIPQFVTFGESQIGDSSEPDIAQKISKHHAEQTALGRSISFAEAAAECCN